jgi:hypothetical protein
VTEDGTGERGAGERGFQDELACTLAVWSAGASTAVPGANLKRLQLSLAPYGFRGEVVFWVRADAAGEALHQVLTGDAPIEIELGVARAHYLGTPPPPLAVRDDRGRPWVDVVRERCERMLAPLVRRGGRTVEIRLRVASYGGRARLGRRPQLGVEPVTTGDAQTWEVVVLRIGRV